MSSDCSVGDTRLVLDKELPLLKESGSTSWTEFTVRKGLKVRQCVALWGSNSLTSYCGLAGIVVQIEPSGAASGHCAYLGLIRSSGASLGPKEELITVHLLRKLAVAGICARLLADPTYLPPNCAVTVRML